MRLRPFSLTHSLVLPEFGSPLLGVGPVMLGELCLGLAVCSRTRPEIQDVLFGAGMESAAKAIRWRRRYDLETAVASFRIYVADYCVMAHRWTVRNGGKPGRPVGAPWQFHMVRVLCSVYHMTPAEAWETPVALARAYYDTDAEIQGTVRLRTAAEQAAIDRKNAEEAAAKEAANGSHSNP